MLANSEGQLGLSSGAEDMRKYTTTTKKNITDSCITQEHHGAKSKLVIASASDASKSMTDSKGGSIHEKILDRELNLTEYERNVRAANGLPFSEHESQQNLGSFVN